MGKKTKLWMRTLPAAFLLCGGLAWSGDRVYAAEGDVVISEENFPDEGFRSYIGEFIDKDKNGILSQNEIDETVEIDFRKTKDDGNVYFKDGVVTGIEYFKNLKKMICGYDSILEGFYPGQFPDLEYLDCSNAWINSTDFSNNQNLKYLNCNDCCWSTLDLSNNLNLEHLELVSNHLYNIDLTRNVNLKYLNCHDCNLNSLDLSLNVNLEYLDCSNNGLEKLDVSKNLELKDLNCSGTSVASLDLTNNSKLKSLVYNCFDNVSLKLGKKPYLSRIECLSPIGTMDISGCELFNSVDTLVNEDGTKGYTDDQISLKVQLDTVVILPKMVEGKEDIAIDATNFPDESFRSFVKQYDIFVEDGYLSSSELLVVKSMTLRNVDSTQSLKGLEFFFNLESLNFYGEELKEIDLSQNTKLKELILASKKLKQLDLSKNTELEILYCEGCRLESLDLSNNKKLKDVAFWTYSCIVDLSGQTDLESVHQEGLATYLNLEGDSKLKRIELYDSDLGTMNINGCTALTDVKCVKSRVTELNLSSCGDIVSVDLEDVFNLKKIDVSSAEKLEELRCDNCPRLEELNMPKKAPLSRFICINSKMKEIDLPPFGQMKEMILQENASLSKVMFPNDCKIEYLECFRSAIKDVDLSGCGQVKKVLFLENDNLETINFPIKVQKVELKDNTNLAEIQFPQNCELISILCWSSVMENVNFSECKDLEKVEITNNLSLKSIDVSKCKYLLELVCYGNALQKLNLLENTNLRSLNCRANQIEELILPKDVSHEVLTSGEDTLKSGNTIVSNSLKNLTCSSNQLKKLELSDCEELAHLDCTKNQIKRIDISSCDELLKRVTGAKEEVSGQAKYVDGIDGGYCLTCDSTVKVIMHGTVDEIFDDIPSGEWFKDAVQYAYNNKIMNGVSDVSFAPKMTLTREQFITVLYNMEGAPNIEFKQIFDDVKNEANVWYAKAVTWAAENKITSGVGNNMFGTGKEITREQLATLLYNYAQQKEEYELTIDENAVANYPDAGQISSWATTGMKWAVSNGVMGGKSGKDGQNFLDPLGKASRAECAQMIKNLKEKAVK